MVRKLADNELNPRNKESTLPLNITPWIHCTWNI